MKNQGYTTALESFLNQYFPGLKLFKGYDSDVIEVHLPEDPKRKEMEELIDKCWELNR